MDCAQSGASSRKTVSRPPDSVHHGGSRPSQAFGTGGQPPDHETKQDKAGDEGPYHDERGPDPAPEKPLLHERHATSVARRSRPISEDRPRWQAW